MLGAVEFSTRFTALVGCRLPIQQAGMGAVSTPPLAAAVARAGGLGMLGAAGLDAQQVADRLSAALAAAGPDARIGINFLVPFLDLAAFDAAATRAVLVECFHGDPDETLANRAHDAGALISWQVGSFGEALAARAAGCDVVVAQGIEAGGHVRGSTSLLTLIDTVRGEMDLPLVAAGGIGSGRAMAAALRAGADAVRVGTRLLATVEADVHPAYADALLQADAADTVVTDAFSMGWPSAPHRVLRSCVVASDADPSKRSTTPPTRAFDGNVEAAALYAGTSVADVHSIQSAEDVVRQLAIDAADELADGPA
jgi:NAD(P)H-dependent flavin oxidoreductase YrpB (nitropropane dioxygenase family)